MKSSQSGTYMAVKESKLFSEASLSLFDLPTVIHDCTFNIKRVNVLDGPDRRQPVISSKKL